MFSTKLMVSSHRESKHFRVTKESPQWRPCKKGTVSKNAGDGIQPLSMFRWDQHRLIREKHVTKECATYSVLLAKSTLYVVYKNIFAPEPWKITRLLEHTELSLSFR